MIIQFVLIWLVSMTFAYGQVSQVDTLPVNGFVSSASYCGINKDGLYDLIISITDPNLNHKVIVMEQIDSFVFDHNQTLTVDSNIAMRVKDILAEDFDSDGDCDILYIAGNEVFMLKNNNNGNFVRIRLDSLFAPLELYSVVTDSGNLILLLTDGEVKSYRFNNGNVLIKDIFSISVGEFYDATLMQLDADTIYLIISGTSLWTLKSKENTFVMDSLLTNNLKSLIGNIYLGVSIDAVYHPQTSLFVINNKNLERFSLNRTELSSYDTVLGDSVYGIASINGKWLAVVTSSALFIDTGTTMEFITAMNGQTISELTQIKATDSNIALLSANPLILYFIDSITMTSQPTVDSTDPVGAGIPIESRFFFQVRNNRLIWKSGEQIEIFTVEGILIQRCNSPCFIGNLPTGIYAIRYSDFSRIVKFIKFN